MLPDEIGNLERLLWLDLSQNDLTVLFSLATFFWFSNF